MKTFYTVINCMDGRVQLPVIDYIQNKFKIKYVDMITEPGPNLILSENKNQLIINSIYNRLEISVNKHNSKGIAIIGHYDCAGNPATNDEQIIQLKKSVTLLKTKYPQLPIIALWFDENFNINEVEI